MRADFTGTPGTDWQLARGTYRFAGPPDNCTGKVSLLNLSSQRVRIRRLMTVKPARARKGFGALPATDVRVRVNLMPGTQAQVRARLVLPETTPPGRYLAHLKTGNETATLEIDVEPVRLLEPDPGDLTLTGRAGETLPVKLTVFNAGNIPVDIQRISPVWLTEDDWNDTILVAALQETSDTDNVSDFARKLLEKARQDTPAPAKLTVEPEPDVALAPGESVDLALALTLPDDLVLGRVYSGFIRLNEERIDLEVYCSGHAEQAPVPATETNER